MPRVGVMDRRDMGLGNGGARGGLGMGASRGLRVGLTRERALK